MTKKNKTVFIQLIALCFLLLCAVLTILYNINLNKQNDTDKNPDPVITPDTNNEPKTEYDPLSDLVNVPKGTFSYSNPYNYDEEIIKYPAANTLLKSGYRLDESSYVTGTNTLSLVLSSSVFKDVYSETTEKTNKLVTKEGKKGGYEYSYEQDTADIPLLEPYYGFIIHTEQNAARLLDSTGKVLVSNFHGYRPAYMTTNAGNPLFIKDGKYYFYYNGKETDEVIYDRITETTLDTITPKDPPSAYYQYLYDMDIIENYLNSEMTDNSHYFTGLAISLPESAGMVEYIRDPETDIDLKLPARNYTNKDPNLFRFASRRYTKTINNQAKIDEANRIIAEQTAQGLPVTQQKVRPTYTFNIEGVYWGYADKNGNVVIAPQFKAAYEFSKDGYAIAVNTDDKVVIINKSGKVVFNAYSNIVYFSDMAKKIRDGHYLPDTYGIENTGMFFFDRSYVRMRRKFVDTAYGYVVKNETETIVSANGSYLNYPKDYKLISYSDGMLLLEKDSKYGYMSHAGYWVVHPDLSYAEPFSEGLAVISYGDSKYGIIDTSGNMVMPAIYDHIETCSGGIVTAYTAGKGWTIYNKLTNLKKEEIPKNPVLALKTRAIAEAKYKYFNNY